MYKCLDIECIKDLDFRSGLATIKLIIAVTVRVIVINIEIYIGNVYHKHKISYLLFIIYYRIYIFIIY